MIKVLAYEKAGKAKKFYKIDTDTSEIVYEEDSSTGGKKTLYCSENGGYYKVVGNGDASLLTEEQAQDWLAEKDPDKFLKIWGRETSEW